MPDSLRVVQGGALVEVQLPTAVQVVQGGALVEVQLPTAIQVVQAGLLVEYVLGTGQPFAGLADGSLSGPDVALGTGLGPGKGFLL